MRIANIKITNMVGLNLDWPLPAVAIIQAKNEGGKTSFIDCLWWPFKNGHDDDMITVGEEQGEIILAGAPAVDRPR